MVDKIILGIALGSFVTGTFFVLGCFFYSGACLDQFNKDRLKNHLSQMDFLTFLALPQSNFFDRFMCYLPRVIYTIRLKRAMEVAGNSITLFFGYSLVLGIVIIPTYFLIMFLINLLGLKTERDFTESNVIWMAITVFSLVYLYVQNEKAKFNRRLDALEDKLNEISSDTRELKR